MESTPDPEESEISFHTYKQVCINIPLCKLQFSNNRSLSQTCLLFELMSTGTHWRIHYHLTPHKDQIAHRCKPTQDYRVQPCSCCTPTAKWIRLMIQIRMNYFLQDLFYLKHFAAHTSSCARKRPRTALGSSIRLKSETIPVVQPAIFIIIFNLYYAHRHRTVREDSSTLGSIILA